MALPQSLSSRFANFPVVRDSQGETTNPTTTTVMADTGAIPADLGGTGVYEVLVVASASARAEFLVQQRNIQNDANVGDAHVFYVPTDVPVAVPFRFYIEVGERVRVMMNANLTGDAAVSVIAQRVA